MRPIEKRQISQVRRYVQQFKIELVGHHRVGGGDFLNTAERIPGGLLGADFDVDSDRYRFRKVFGGLNWNPELRSPLTEPGVDVVAGEYLLAVEEMLERTETEWGPWTIVEATDRRWARVKIFETLIRFLEEALEDRGFPLPEELEDLFFVQQLEPAPETPEVHAELEREAEPQG